MLNCLNCQTPTQPDAAKLFAEVFVCPRCYELAERAEQRCVADLRRLQLMVREAIRVALVEGKLHPGVASLEELPKAELLREIVRLSEKKDGRPPPVSV
jgi:hypothetical protein